MLEFIRNITSRRDEDGASAVEYGLLVAGIAALIVAIVFALRRRHQGRLREHLQHHQGQRLRPPPPADLHLTARIVTRSDPLGPGSARIRVPAQVRRRFGTISLPARVGTHGPQQ